MPFGGCQGIPVASFRVVATTGATILANTANGLSIGVVPSNSTPGVTGYMLNINEIEIATNITTSMLLTTGKNQSAGGNQTICYIPGYGSGFSGKLDRGKYNIDSGATLYLNSVGSAITIGEIIINCFK